MGNGTGLACVRAAVQGGQAADGRAVCFRVTVPSYVTHDNISGGGAAVGGAALHDQPDDVLAGPRPRAGLFQPEDLTAIDRERFHLHSARDWLPAYDQAELQKLEHLTSHRRA